MLYTPSIFPTRVQAIKNSAFDYLFGDDNNNSSSFHQRTLEKADECHLGLKKWADVLVDSILLGDQKGVERRDIGFLKVSCGVPSYY